MVEALVESGAQGQIAVAPAPKIEGEKITIPQPAKFTGEDKKVNVKLWLVQVERYLSAKKKPRAEWGDIAFAFNDGMAAQIWEVRLHDLNRASLQRLCKSTMAPNTLQEMRN